jgi:hypothetical protein
MKTKSEILKGVSDNPLNYLIAGLGKKRVIYPGPETLGSAIAKAVEIFCHDIHDLNPEFKGVMIADKLLMPFIEMPTYLYVKTKSGFDGLFGMDAKIALLIVWGSALSKASRHWTTNNEHENSNLCLEIFKDIFSRVPIKKLIPNIHQVDEWENILNNKKLKGIL